MIYHKCMESLLNKVKEIVIASSKYFFDSFDVNEKDNKDNVVTTADLAIQNYLIEELGKLLPGSGFYCEEEDKSDIDKEYIWIIDPIDGTYNFARNIPGSCISVALKHNDGIIIGVVYNPISKELFSSELGKGAFLNDKKISVSQVPFNKALFSGSLCLYHKEYSKMCSDIILDIVNEASDTRRYGSSALELCYIACGRLDLLFEFRLYPWDIAAARLILKEAGGYISREDGREFNYIDYCPCVAANSKENINKLMSIVNKHIKNARN